MKHLLLNILKLLFWLFLCQLPGLAGAGTVQPNLAWYHSLRLPPLIPPDSVFGITWGILYILLGISAFLAFRQGLYAARKPLILFIVQLALHAWWTPIFFGSHNPTAALLILLLMLAEGIWLYRVLQRRNRISACLLVPYLIWLIYAGYLNAGVWYLN